VTKIEIGFSGFFSDVEVSHVCEFKNKRTLLIVELHPNGIEFSLESANRERFEYHTRSKHIYCHLKGNKFSLLTLSLPATPSAVGMTYQL